MSEKTMPELPEPVSSIDLAAWGPKPDYYTADQLHAYAKAYAAAETAALREDAERLDWFDAQVEAYGFESEHLGNRWLIEGPFKNVREAIDAARVARG